MLYKIVGRRNDGAWMEKVTLDCDLDTAKLVGSLMANSPRYEVYENGKDYIGDFRAKPIYKNYE